MLIETDISIGRTAWSEFEWGWPWDMWVIDNLSWHGILGLTTEWCSGGATTQKWTEVAFSFRPKLRCCVVGLLTRLVDQHSDDRLVLNGVVLARNCAATELNQALDARLDSQRCYRAPTVGVDLVASHNDELGGETSSRSIKQLHRLDNTAIRPESLRVSSHVYFPKHTEIKACLYRWPLKWHVLLIRLPLIYCYCLKWLEGTAHSTMTGKSQKRK